MKMYENMPQITGEEVAEALKICTGQLLNILPEFTYAFQTAASKDLFYGKAENRGWTSAFLTGEYWLGYEFSGDEKLREAALIQCESFRDRLARKIGVGSHDMGFLYSLSCVAEYKLTGSEQAKQAGIEAADILMTMFREKGNFIQSVNDPTNKQEYRMIVDTLLNLPLLFWASEVTGDPKYRETALIHFATTDKYILREDGSTSQAARFDNETGEFLHNYTRQGFSDTSAWARGQSWAIYGPAIAYKYTGEEICRNMFRQAASYYMEHLPEDMVNYFDLCITEGDEWPRDTSASAVAVCGMLEMAQFLEKDEAQYYVSSAKKIMKALVDQYMIRDYSRSNGLMTGATYCCKTPYNVCDTQGMNECCSFGDYFFMEALVRLHQDFKMYW